MIKSRAILLLAGIVTLFLMIACENGIDDIETTEDNTIINTYFENSIADALDENKKDHDNTQDYIWNSSNVVKIVLSGNSITVDGTGATVIDNEVTIASSGTYEISGTLNDGRIIVETDDEDLVRLILNKINIKNSTTTPFFIKKAKKTIIILKENTQNFVSDASSYINEEDANAAIYSKDDLTIFGNGSLIIEANYNDGITSKDGLIIKSGNITINAVDDGIRGKDYLIVKGGSITINAYGNGFISDNEDDVTKGYVYIKDGVINITSRGDAIQAETDVLVAAGDITITSGGGSNSRINANSSAKGLKGGVCVIIEGATLAVNSADDAIHSNSRMVINSGSIDISSGDDGIHSDSTLGIYGGEIVITKSYEGIESGDIVIDDGNIHIVSSDDGINAGGGNDAGMGGGPRGNQSQNNNFLYINGGYIVVDASGDGIDVNGKIEMTDGVLIVNGPTSNNNGALDYDASFKLTGGFLVAVGSSRMAQPPSNISSQYIVSLKSSSTLQAGKLIHIQDSSGTEIFSFIPTKRYSSVVCSSPNFIKGTTYDVYYGGSSTGIIKDGLYQNGIYTPGTKKTSFTISSIITTVR